MMRKLLSFALIATTAVAFGQARFVMNDGAYVVLNNGTSYVNGSWLVIQNPAPNAITTLGAGGGNIVSEGEFNMVRWAIGNTGGLHTVPFTNNFGNKIPVLVEPTGGSAGGSLVFSTYEGANWDNTGYRPSDVTHMNIWGTGSPNNSDYVIDRFWIVDPSAVSTTSYAYAPKPTTVNMTLYFDPANDIKAGNVITPAVHNLGAQRFNNSNGKWGDMLPIGTDNVNNVGTGNIPAANFFRSWTLVEQSNPLPIELLSFDARCNGDHVLLNWTTATEKDNDYFTIEKSLDGVEFSAIGTIQGAGQSVGSIDYSFVDEQTTAIAYYRLRQTDFDGTTTTGPTVAAGCETTGGIQIVNAWDDGSNVHLLVSSTSEHVFELNLLDGHGKSLLSRGSQVVNEGITEITMAKNGIATGMYVLRLHNNEELLTRKIVLK